MSTFNFLLLVILCIVSTIYGQNKCSLEDDQYFDLSKNKCKDCRRCPRGRGRRLHQATNDQEINKPTECLPCITCDPGTFNDGNGLTSECRKCTKNKCSNLYRQVQKNCTLTEDFECGHCLPGYEDIYRRTALQCYKKTTRTKIIITNTPESLPINNRTIALPKMEQRTHSTVQLMLPLIFTVLGMILLCLIGMSVYCTLFRRKRYRHSVEGVPCDHGQSSSSIVTKDSDESSLLVDGPDGKQGDNVRGELSSVSVVSQSTVGGRPVDYQKDGLFSFFEFEKKCSCCPNDCGLSCVNTQTNGMVRKDSKLLQEIASRICHDPSLLFYYLEIPDCEVYVLDDDRQRSPHKISQREFIHSVLKRWTEIKPTDATVGKIRQALCNAGFHRINENIFSR